MLEQITRVARITRWCRAEKSLEMGVAASPGTEPHQPGGPLGSLPVGVADA